MKLIKWRTAFRLHWGLKERVPPQHGQQIKINITAENALRGSLQVINIRLRQKTPKKQKLCLYSKAEPRIVIHYSQRNLMDNRFCNEKQQHTALYSCAYNDIRTK